MTTIKIPGWFVYAIGIVTGVLIALLLKPKAPAPDIEIQYKDSIVYVPDIDTIYLTNTIKEINKNFYKIPDTSYIYDTIILEIADTYSKELLAKIAQEHYNVYIYNDTVAIDTIGHVTIIDSIQANKIINRSVAYDIDFKVTPPRTNAQHLIAAGSSFLTNKEQKDIGIGAMYSLNNDWHFGYDYYFLQNSHVISIKKTIFTHHK